MPNVQQKKLNKDSLITLVFLVLMIAVIFVKTSFWLKVGAEVLLLLLFVFIRRSYIVFAKASTAMKMHDYEKGFKLLDKALAIGLDEERQVLVGQANIQQGDAQHGIDILDKVINSPKKSNFKESAIVTRSMGYWRLGQRDKAIESLEELRKTGYKDDNLSINLEAYYLETGNLKKAKAIITESRKGGVENNGLMDNRGWYYILAGEWKKAEEIYNELIDERNARFPEAYLHAAQVNIHNNDILKAIDRLGWGTSKLFSRTCTVTREYLEKIILGLENPKTRVAFAKAMEENIEAVSRGLEFSGLEMAVEFDKSEVSEEDMPKNTSAPIVDDDDREPNTDLDEEDEVLDHQYHEEVDEEISEGEINTTVDDDDDREPNTELGEDD